VRTPRRRIPAVRSEDWRGESPGTTGDVMKRLVKNLLITLSGNARFQRLLQKNVLVSQYLMGIGSGSGVDSSGETVLVQRLRQLSAQTQQPLCVFDVGANKGDFLRLIVSGLQGLPFCAHAFEPSQYTFKMLSENAKGYSNTLLNNFGLGKQSGEFELFYDEVGSGLASLSRRRLDQLKIEFKHSEKVRIETLDDYCRQRRVQGIDLLKLDVEGHELDVLQGGVQMFLDQRIRMVSFEFGGCNIDSRTFFQDFWYFCKEHGMGSLFRMTPSGFLVPLQQYNEMYEQFRTTNFLALQG
jgi:FkbM family methyltransferase